MANFIKPSVDLLTDLNGLDILKKIEIYGRTCYKSEDRITEDSAKNFVQKIIDRGHESVLEHINITVRIICDRGVSHELVRHRIASYSQESTRYCNYSKDRFGNELTFIIPCFFHDNMNLTDDHKYVKYKVWEFCMYDIETVYFKLLEQGATPQEARSVLPNSLKTEVVTTMNLRSWRHFLKLRTAPAAHPQMREIANMILIMFQNKVPIIFDDIKINGEI